MNMFAKLKRKVKNYSCLSLNKEYTVLDEITIGQYKEISIIDDFGHKIWISRDRFMIIEED